LTETELKNETKTEIEMLNKTEIEILNETEIILETQRWSLANCVPIHTGFCTIARSSRRQPFNKDGN
jgi:hypothetical protein